MPPLFSLRSTSGFVPPMSFYSGGGQLSSYLTVLDGGKKLNRSATGAEQYCLRCEVKRGNWYRKLNLLMHQHGGMENRHHVVKCRCHLWKVEFQGDRPNGIFLVGRNGNPGAATPSGKCESKRCAPAQLFRNIKYMVSC